MKRSFSLFLVADVGCRQCIDEAYFCKFLSLFIASGLLVLWKVLCMCFAPHQAEKHFSWWNHVCYRVALMGEDDMFWSSVSSLCAVQQHLTFAAFCYRWSSDLSVWPFQVGAVAAFLGMHLLDLEHLFAFLMLLWPSWCAPFLYAFLSNLVSKINNCCASLLGRNVRLHRNRFLARSCWNCFWFLVTCLRCLPGVFW